LNPVDSAKDCRFCSGLAETLPIIDNVKLRKDIKLARFPILNSKALLISGLSMVNIDSLIMSKLGSGRDRRVVLIIE
jgi:hypothetical protein